MQSSSQSSNPAPGQGGRSGGSWFLVAGGVGLAMFLAIGGGVVALILVLNSKSRRRRRNQ